MKVLSVTSECAPLVKTGGLADVAGALPKVLASEGCEVRTLLPGYPAVMQAVGKSAEVVKVTNPVEIARRGVMSTPGLAIDGKLVSTGRVLAADEIGRLLP